MKFYYSTGACSLSPRIALLEAGLPFDAVKADLKTKLTADGGDLRTVNPKGQVPVLVLDDGTVLTEGPVILQWIADQVPDKALAPPVGTKERYELMAVLNHLTSDVHKTLANLFGATFSDEVKPAFRAMAGKKFDVLAQRLAKQPYLMGDRFSVADGYLFNLLTWLPWIGMDLAQWPALAEFHARIGARPTVATAMAGEGLKT